MGTPKHIREATAKQVAKAAAKTDPDPTDAQKASGNYRKGRISIHGLNISIENAKGGYRSGVEADGKEWRCLMPAHYGQILGTEGKDKNPVDVWIGPNPKAQLVWIVNQQK